MLAKPIKSKALGAPFAKPSAKPWQVQIDPGLVALIALTVTVYFRRDFGERYLKPQTIFTGALVLAVDAVAMRYVAVRIGDGAPVPFWSMVSWLIFAMLYFSYVSVQLFQAVRRNDPFSDEFSFSDGRPRKWLLRLLPIFKDEWDIELLVEPTLCALLGVTLLYAGNWFSVYIIIASLCAFDVARRKRALRRHSELNVLDARLQATTLPDFEASVNDSIPVSFKAFTEEHDEGQP